MNKYAATRLAKRPSRVAIGNLIESFDLMDATRSHELMPSSRLQSRHNTRRALHMLVVSFVSVASLVALASCQ